jgi:hypothetical protein
MMTASRTRGAMIDFELFADNEFKNDRYVLSLATHAAAVCCGT